MKIYIAGPLAEESQRKFLEEINSICQDLGFTTFLPHKDAGLYNGDHSKIPELSKRDVEEIKNCDLMIGVLNGITIGPGTAWEIGYAAALKKPVIGLKTDRPIKDSIPDISVIIAGQVNIVESIEALKQELKKLL